MLLHVIKSSGVVNLIFEIMECLEFCSDQNNLMIWLNEQQGGENEDDEAKVSWGSIGGEYWKGRVLNKSLDTKVNQGRGGLEINYLEIIVNWVNN